MGENNLNLPPGFRFYPTDEELIVHFLQRKVALFPCHPDVIPDLDLYPYDPWQLNGKALREGSRWYFYSRKTENRVTENGYWEALGADEQVVSRATSQVVGMKKYFVFHSGAVKTNWIMHEYRLSDAASTSSTRRKPRPKTKRDYSKWVVCRVYQRDEDKEEEEEEEEEEEDGTELSCLDELFLSLDDLDEITLPNRIQ